MSKVNRNLRGVKNYATDTSEYLVNTMQKLLNLSSYLDVVISSTEDPKLQATFRNIGESLDTLKTSILHIDYVNKHLINQTSKLTEALGSDGRINIDTDVVESALGHALIAVRSFSAFVSKHTEDVVSGIRTRLICQKLVEFKSKVRQKIVKLENEKNALSEAKIAANKDGKQNTDHEAETRINAKIGYLNRVLYSIDNYAENMEAQCRCLEKLADQAYGMNDQFQHINSLVGDKISKIKQALSK